MAEQVRLKATIICRLAGFNFRTFFFFLIRFLFETGRLAPQYDYFRCVVNIPEDVQRVGEPSEAGEQVSGEKKQVSFHLNFIPFTIFPPQLSVMAGAPIAKMYGAATMVGKDERNGRINPALEADDDLPVAEARKQIHRHIQSGGNAAAISGISSIGGSQGHTAF